MFLLEKLSPDVLQQRDLEKRRKRAIRIGNHQYDKTLRKFKNERNAFDHMIAVCPTEQRTAWIEEARRRGHRIASHKYKKAHLIWKETYHPAMPQDQSALDARNALIGTERRLVDCYYDLVEAREKLRNR